VGEMADYEADRFSDWQARDGGPVTVEGWIKHTTDKAILLEVDGEETWLPKSQIPDQDWDHLFDEKVTVEVPFWLAKQKGWADDEE